MLTVAVLLVAGGVAAAGWLIWEFVHAPVQRDPVVEAYDTLPAGCPELHVDTATGSHDRYPHMSDRARDAVLGALESAWHTTPKES